MRKKFTLEGNQSITEQKEERLVARWSNCKVARWRKVARWSKCKVARSLWSHSSVR